MRKFCNIKLTFIVATKIVAATLDVTDVLLADILWKIIIQTGLILISSKVQGKTI